MLRGAELSGAIEEEEQVKEWTYFEFLRAFKKKCGHVTLGYMQYTRLYSKVNIFYCYCYLFNISCDRDD